MNNIPNIPQNNNVANTPANKETASNRVVTKSHQIKKVTSNVTRTRASFKKFLRGFDIDLLTSLVLLNQTGDFVESSIVIYLKNNNYTESLGLFVKRYPQYLEPVTQIAKVIKNLNQKVFSESDLEKL
jgi:hypothetical protein